MYPILYHMEVVQIRFFFSVLVSEKIGIALFKVLVRYEAY